MKNNDKLSDSSEPSEPSNVLKSILCRFTRIFAKTKVDDSSENDNFFLDNNKEIMENILHFSTIIVNEVMVPRADIVALPIDVTIDRLADILVSKRHTRMPIYRDNIDNIIGFVHIKDILPFIVDRRLNFKINLILRQMLIAPASMNISHLMHKMRKSCINIAVIVDEYGGTDGIVTIEDLIEQIIGEIEDEHDVARVDDVIMLDDNTWLINARANIEDVERILNIVLKDEEQFEECHTIAGLLLAISEKVPNIGEKIYIREEYEFEILDADPRMIKKVQLKI